MLERRRRLDLLHESLAADHGGQLGLKQLEGDVAVVLQVGAQVHRRHPALTDVSLDAVAAGQGRVEAVGLLSHAGPGRVRLPAITLIVP